MQSSFKALVFAAGFITSLAAAAECTPPEQPSLPDGATSTMEEMIAGQQAVKAFQADAQAFRACIDTEIESLRPAADDGDAMAAESFAAKTDAYNASVAAEEKVANNFNAQIRAYKEANAS